MQTNLKLLSLREQEILRLVATGASNKEIAQRLSISTNTVKVHLRNIFEKIGVNSRTEAAMVAVNAGLISAFPQDGSIEKSEASSGTNPKINTYLLREEKTKIEGKITFRNILIVIFVTVIFLGIGAAIYWRWRSISKVTPASQTGVAWTSLASMHTARSGFAAVVYENEIYALGGENKEHITGTVEKYDPEFNQWTSLGSMPLAVADVQAAEVGGRIFLPGGRLASGEISDGLQIYDPNGNKWSIGKSLPIPTSAYAMVEYEGKVYLFGGQNREGFLSSVLVYDPGQDSWSYKTPMQSPKAFSGAAVVGSRIYLLGGRNEKEIINSVEVYQPELEDGVTNPWSNIDQMPDKRYGMGTASVLEVIYLVGGKGEGQAAMPMQGFLTSTHEWQVIRQPDEAEWNKMGLVALGNNIYAFGGEFKGEPSSVLYSMQVVFISVLPFVP